MKKIIIAISFLLAVFSNTDLKAQSWASLYDKVEYFYNQGDYQNAILYAKKTVNQADIEFGKNDFDYAESIFNLAVLYNEVGQYDKALPLYHESIEIIKNLDENNSLLGTILIELAFLYYSIGLYEDAIKFNVEGLGNIEKSLGKSHSKYGIGLNNLGLIYSDLGQFEEALPFYLQALEITGETLGKHHFSYGVTLNNLGVLYSELGQYDNALSFFFEALEITGKTMGLEHSAYATRLNNIANLYGSMGYYEEALPFYLQALEITGETLGKHHFRYGVTLNNLGVLYSNLGQYEKALPLNLEALEITEKTLGQEHPNYVFNLTNLATLFNIMGYYQKALTLYQKALDIIKNAHSEEYLNYDKTLYNLALLYKAIGQYDKALSFSIEALEIAEKKLGKVHPIIGNYLNAIGLIYFDLGQKEKAIPLLVRAHKNTKKTIGENHPDYGIQLSNMAVLYCAVGQYDEALSFSLEAVGITEKTVGKEHHYYGVSLNNLAVVYYEMGKYESALRFCTEAKENTEKTLGKNHIDYGVRLNNIATFHSIIGQYENALSYYIEAIDNTNKQIENVFSFMSENEKENFLNTIDFNFNIYQSFFTRYSTDKQEVAQHAYDIELAIKGMILQSGIQTRQVILNSGDSTALEKFDKWSMYKNILAKQYSLPIAERRSDLKELENKTENVEAELSRLSAIFTENKALSGIRWQDIQKQLGNNEVAIEFASFNYRNNKEWTDSTLYIALVLTKKDKHPRLITLFEQQQLDSLLASKGNSDAEFVSNLYQNNSGLYELVWQPLEEYIPKGSTVYFAPSGSLHQIAMHAISLPDGSVLSDAYNLHQLSTTAMLTRQVEKTNTLPQQIALFGGIRYDATSTSPQTPTNEDFLTQKLSFSLPKDLERGSESWTYLPGTLKEVEKIATIADKQNINFTLHIGKEAEEEEFKQLSGKKSPEVIHIATHGFFFPDPKKDKPDNLIRLDNEKQVYKQSDNPLYRSGLLFAGANKAWLGEEQTNGEDGILSAYEVSYQYLGNTKLVVLSACETGLGDIKGSEGVFGLQRAFKASGVKYLMMSLWKVPDAATSEFMESFYTEWFKGNTIEQAFQNTQNQMKTKYPNEPYKWAGFVLVE